MFRVSLDNVSAHRTCTPLHEKHQATAYATFLSDTETGDIYSGQVMAKNGEDTVRRADADDTAIVGLAALDRNPTIDDTEGLGSVPFAVWQGGPDAYFEVDAPAFDETQAYAVPTDGTRVLLRANATGQLSSLGTLTGPAVAELIEVVSATRIIVRLLAN